MRKRFEYSTQPEANFHALSCVASEVFAKQAPEEIRDKIFRLQNVFLAELDTRNCEPFLYENKHRSGILSLKTTKDPDTIWKAALERGLVVTARGECLRIAPHFFNTDAELSFAAGVINSVL